jgi:hypothetical protein
MEIKKLMKESDGPCYLALVILPQKAMDTARLPRTHLVSTVLAMATTLPVRAESPFQALYLQMEQKFPHLKVVPAPVIMRIQSRPKKKPSSPLLLGFGVSSRSSPFPLFR